MRTTWILALGLALGLTAACTRKTDNHSLSIKVPVAQKLGALVNTYELDIAIANVVIPGRPAIVVKKEMHGPNAVSIPIGSPITFDIPIANAPAGSGIYVQILSIYRGSDNGDLKFFYGDANAVLQAATEVVVNTAASGTSSGKEAHIAGRYFNAAGSGPTGELVMFFDMGNGKLPMIVERKAMVNGWFEAFAVQGANFDLRVNGELIFDDLNLDASGALQHRVAGVMTPVSFGTTRLNMLKPLNFRREDGTLRPQPETRLILGYFDNAGDSLVTATARKVVYPTSSGEGIPGSYANNTGTAPQNYNTGGGGTDVRPSSGGAADTFQNVYGMAVTGCGPTEYNAGNCLIFQHSKLGSGREAFSGMSVPFRSLNLLSQHESFLVTRFLAGGCSGVNCIEIKWSMLPDTISAIAEIDLYYKTSNNDGWGGGDLRCEDLQGMGYVRSSPGTSIAPGLGGTFHTDAALTESAARNYSFFACAKDHAGKYVGRPVHSSCMGGCDDMRHLGWAPSGTTTINANTTHSGIRRITGNVNTTSPFFTTVDVNSISGAFISGDEVMIYVAAARGAGACGTINGQNVQVGQYGFARLVESVTGSTVKVAKGSLLDALAGVNNTYYTNSAMSANFCWMQMAKVLHYHDLTINSGFYLTPAALSFAAPTYGGVLPIRVSGKLAMSLNGGIKATATGFPGGSMGYNGAGTDWDQDTVGYSVNGGRTGSFGAGGGGHGRGGRNGANLAGEGIQNGWTGNARLVMGGGGGGPSISGSGSAGGGVVFLMAREIEVTSSGNKIDASGGNVLSGDGGAGGGGSVFVMARKISGGGSLTIAAKGGDSLGVSNGGAGGGGSVARLMCVNDAVLPVSVSSSVAIGTGADSAANAQAGTDQDWSVSGNTHMCSDYN